MPATLTETANRAAICRAKDGERVELADSAFRGLRLRIGTTGKAKWALACRDQGGRMRRFEVGAWPGKGIGDARREAETLRGDRAEPHPAKPSTGSDIVAPTCLAIPRPIQRR